jgi:hypothetical protein
MPGASGPSSASQGKRSSVAGRIGAKITTDGIDKLTGSVDKLLTSLRKVRMEMLAINSGGKPVATGTVQGSSMSQLGAMIAGFSANAPTTATNKNTAGVPGPLIGPPPPGPPDPRVGSGPPPVGPGGMSQGAPFAGRNSLFGTGLSALGFSNVVGTINARTNRNMVQSVGISQSDTLMSSMYGPSLYRVAEMARFNATGRYGGSREEQLAASGIGMRFGQTFDQNMNFMQSVGRVVQASGGTMSASQAAQSSAGFLDPLVMHRARGLGVQMGKVGGQVQNPLQVSMSYLKQAEQMTGAQFNEADLINMQDPGNRIRFFMKRRFGIGDNEVDMISQAGMQNLQFRQTSNRDINFDSEEDLNAIGANNSRLGLKSTELTTASGRREARFFANQEGSMVNRLGTEITLQNTLAEVEDAFGGVIGKLYEFERVIKALSGAMAVMGGMNVLGGGLGRGGGGVVGGAPGAAGKSAVGKVAAAAAGKGLLGGKAGAMATTRLLGGAGLAIGAGIMAHNTTSVAGIGGSVAMGAAAGAMIGGPAAPVTAAIGGAIAGGYAATRYFKSRDRKNVQEGFMDALSLDDKQLLEKLPSYKAGRAGGVRGAGPKERGAFDVFAARRGALIAALLDNSTSAGIMNDLPGSKAAEVRKLIEFYSSDGTADDMKWAIHGAMLQPILEKVQAHPQGKKLYREYFGNVSHPYAFEAITTGQYKSLIQNAQSIIQNPSTSGGGRGDPVEFERISTGVGKGNGNPWSGDVRDGRSAGHQTFDKLDPRMKKRLQDLIVASGGRVWVGEGWRSTQAQQDLFLQRYRPSPDGERTWRGQKWTRVTGAPVAAPGTSMHEIGLAADLVGDMDWLQQNAAKYGLRTFAEVNNEPWHVQLAELPDRVASLSDADGSEESPDAALSGHDPAVMAGGGGSVSISSGVGYSIAGSIGRSSASIRSSANWGGLASQTAGGSAWSGEETLSAEQVARLAHEAGFRGQDLVHVVAIAKRESGYRVGAYNPDRSTKDDSYGLMQINMLGDMGPARRRMFGIQTNEELYDPRTNMRAAFMLYQNRGGKLDDWGAYKGKDNTYSTDVQAAALAVANAGLQGGDPVESSMRPRFATEGSAAGGVTINFGGVTIHSSGNGAVDADAFLREVVPKLEEVAGMVFKRTSG